MRSQSAYLTISCLPTTSITSPTTTNSTPTAAVTPCPSAKSRPIWERYGRMRPGPTPRSPSPTSVIISDARGSPPILTDSADPHHPTAFTDTSQSVLWAAPAQIPDSCLSSDLWAEPAPLPSDLSTPSPKILGHRPKCPNSSFSPFSLPSPYPYSPNVQSLSPIPTVNDPINMSIPIKVIPNPYSLSPNPDPCLTPTP